MRAGTRAEHDALDALFGRFDLATRDGYTRFLAAHAECVLPLEAALDTAQAERVIDDWRARRRGDALRSDLAALDTTVPAAEQITLSSSPEIVGTIYVLEGSRLGGRLLSQRVGEDLPRAYLDADQFAGSWRALLVKFDSILYQQADMSRAISAARAVFHRFDAAGRNWLTKE